MTFHLNSPSGGGATFGTGSVTGLRGEPGIGYFRLNLTIDFVVEPAREIPAAQVEGQQINELVAEVRLGGRALGRFIPLSPGYLPVRSYTSRSNRQSIRLTCELDRARVEAIEVARSGGNLPLDVSIQGRFSDGTQLSVGEPMVVNQGVWVDVLSEMCYQRTLLVEVPAPDTATQPELAEAVSLLAQAQRHRQLGHDRDAVGALRDVLEQIRLAFGDDDTINGDLERVLFGGSRAMSKGERLRVLRRALMLVTHPARHRDQVSVAIDWSRTDSAQMITMVAAFLNEMSAPDARPPQRPSDPSPLQHGGPQPADQ